MENRFKKIMILAVTLFSISGCYKADLISEQLSTTIMSTPTTATDYKIIQMIDGARL